MKPPRNDPDLIIVGQPCHTLATATRTAEALAIRRGRIIACGGRRSILSLRRRGTRVLDLRPAAITPGLVDCHTHFLYWALSRALGIDVSDLASLDAVLRRIRAQGRKRLVGDWIVARGFDHNRWGNDFPTAADLEGSDQIEFYPYYEVPAGATITAETTDATTGDYYVTAMGFVEV